MSSKLEAQLAIHKTCQAFLKLTKHLRQVVLTVVLTAVLKEQVLTVEACGVEVAVLLLIYNT